MGKAKVILPINNLASDSLPPFCICCGEPAALFKPEKFKYHYATEHGPEMGGQRSVTKKYKIYTFQVPLCQKHQNRLLSIGYGAWLVSAVPTVISILGGVMGVMAGNLGLASVAFSFAGVFGGIGTAVIFFLALQNPRVTFADASEHDYTGMVEISGVSKQFAIGCQQIQANLANNPMYKQVVWAAKIRRTIQLVGIVLAAILVPVGLILSMMSMSWFDNKTGGDRKPVAKSNDSNSNRRVVTRSFNIPKNNPKQPKNSSPNNPNSNNQGNDNQPPEKPVDPGPVIPTEATSVADALAMLQSDDRRRVESALRWLENTSPEVSERSQVADAMIPLLAKLNHRNARNVLAKWATEDHVAALAELADQAGADGQQDYRKSLVMLLGDLKNPEALPAIASYFADTGDARGCEQVFQSIGPDSAPELLPHINSDIRATRDVANKLIAEFGTDSKLIVKQCVADVTDDRRRVFALSRLLRTPVDDTIRAEVSRGLNPLLAEYDEETHIGLMNAFKVWGTPLNTMPLIELSQAVEGKPRDAILGVLVELKDPRGVSIISDGLFGKGFFKHRAAYDRVMKMGPVAEEAIWIGLDNEKWIPRKEACEMLGKIGTTKSLPRLRKIVASDSSRFVKGAAGAAVATITESGRKPVDEIPPVPGGSPAAVPESKTRLWTESTGKFKVEAEFVDFTDGIVRLMRTDNGTILSLPIDRLSDEDQAVAKRFAAN